jgi:hypothetical protein
MTMTDPIDQLRTICLTLPEVTEENEGTVGSPAFKVRGKIFAMQHPHEGRPSMWCKAPRGFQETLVSSDPKRYFVPPYVGVHGWIGVWLDVEQDWGMVEDFVTDSYRMTAPKRLIGQLDQKK